MSEGCSAPDLRIDPTPSGCTASTSPRSRVSGSACAISKPSRARPSWTSSRSSTGISRNRRRVRAAANGHIVGASHMLIWATTEQMVAGGAFALIREVLEGRHGPGRSERSPRMYWPRSAHPVGRGRGVRPCCGPIALTRPCSSSLRPPRSASACFDHGKTTLRRISASRGAGWWADDGASRAAGRAKRPGRPSEPQGPRALKSPPILVAAPFTPPRGNARRPDLRRRRAGAAARRRLGPGSPPAGMVEFVEHGDVGGTLPGRGVRRRPRPTVARGPGHRRPS